MISSLRVRVFAGQPVVLMARKDIASHEIRLGFVAAHQLSVVVRDGGILGGGVLTMLGTFTAALITALVWYLLKSKSFSHPHPDRLNRIVPFLVLLTIATVTSYMLFCAFAYGEAYGIGSRDTGRVYPVSQDPVSYWVLVAIYYIAAVAAWSFALVVGARLIQPRRSGSEADFRKKALERVSKRAGPSADKPSDPKSGMGASPYESLQRLWQYAAIVYIAGAWIALYVVWRGDWSWSMPRHRVGAVVFAPIFVFLGLLAIYTGEVWLQGYVRSKTPVAYWTWVAVLLLMGIGLFLIGFGVIAA